jgi:hypothetical protein
MKFAEVKVGTRNREKTASQVELLFTWEDLLDKDGPYYGPMVSKGITLEEGEDYRILDSDGAEVTLRSAPEKVRRLIVVEMAHRLNVPTSVKVPENKASIATADRNWVSFRPRIDMPFANEAARAEYVEKNGGTAATHIEPSLAGADDEESE